MIEKNDGCVYFFRHIGLAPVKIGYSENESPINRFNQFKTYAPYGAEMLGFINSRNSKKLETELHKKYRDKRMIGEWFDLTDEDVAGIINYYATSSQLIERSVFWEEFAKTKRTFKDDFSEVKMYDDLGEMFVIFMESNVLNPSKINRSLFRREYMDFSNMEITPQEFNKRVRVYCLRKEIKLTEKKYNGNFFFYFEGDKEKNCQ